ncbi:MAG: hypothetical protein ABIH82_06360 [Candidatus Woesearchaeota archaeon]
MNNKNLLEYSKNIKTQAKNILDNNKIISTLKKVGEPIIIGSYPLDLMVDPDIDIVVLTKNPQKSSLKVLNEFIKQRSFQKYEYGDFVKFKRVNRPQGFIVNLRTEINTIKWEIEIWFLKDVTKELKMLELLKKNLTVDKKLEVLKLKQKRNKDGKNKHEMSSLSIYKQILNI